MSPVFVPGATITRREVLHGHTWLSHPVTVVEDTGTELAVLLSPGSPFTFPPAHPHGVHPWAEHTHWGGTQVLQVMREGDLYGAWRFFDPVEDGSAFRHTYLNFESAIVRTEDGFDTDDHGLDLIVHPDGRREWKDVEDLHGQLREGRIDASVVLAVLAETERVVAELDSGTPWWSRWDGWRPPTG